MKETAPGWPDPTDWINRLHAQMAERQANYEAEPDTLLKRNKAGGMLLAVVSALRELPSFKNDSAHMPLKDLLIFLNDLDRGRDHPWSAPFNVGGTNITTTAQGELKIWVRAAFQVLVANDFKRVEAYRRLADGLTKSGRRVRNGPVRWQLVQQWCLEEEAPREAAIREKLSRWWSDFRNDTAGIKAFDRRGQLATEKYWAGEFADSCWSLQHIRDRSFSGISE